MIAVTGATGNVGQTLVRVLAAAGEPVTALSRRTPAQGELPAGVDHHQVDLTAPEELRAALDGAEALFLLPAPDLLGPGGRPYDLVGAAKAAGVRRVVLLSSQAAGTRPDAASHEPLRVFEAAVRESGVDWTVLRGAGFASNAFAWAESVRTARTVAAPFADVALPVVDPADIAAAAAVVLRDAGHTGRTYALTGPVPVSPREQAAVIGEVLGEPLRFVELGREEARSGMLRFMPEAVADGTLDILGQPLPAERRVSPDAEALLGRPARPFAAWVARNAAAFR
ncbi:NAD(P)H-binding protein [Streptomyces sp. MI02-7b]|uniref:NAD(P)H-binding protein n=1 Tax=Streptomyces sp. MI02-7b TaxID=462941 RepID=UPI0029A901E4|nr:NAD(P)H-binding protein [Streptomyces sp. MI02-7b]MDX3076172.1 NAD(P)H-binding protein [Streptomyces sp. MI02-7b]